MGLIFNRFGALAEDRRNAMTVIRTCIMISCVIQLPTEQNVLTVFIWRVAEQKNCETIDATSKFKKKTYLLKEQTRRFFWNEGA
jgi:hypothetical protein